MTLRAASSIQSGCCPAATSDSHRMNHLTILTSQALLEITRTLQNWVEQRGYRGYEPFDGLSSWLRPLACGRQLPLRVLQQIVRQSPVNVRPLLGVRPKDSTKGRGYMAWGYLTLYRADPRPDLLDKASACLKWLDRHKVPRFKHHSWSNHFDFVSRGGLYTSDDPIIVWTALIGHAYVDAFEITGDPWYLEIARSVCDWIMELPRERTNSGTCLSYLSDRQISIHNANMLGAGILARTAKHCGQGLSGRGTFCHRIQLFASARRRLLVVRRRRDVPLDRQLPHGVQPR